MVRLTALEEADLRAEHAECSARKAEIDEILARDRWGDTPLVHNIKMTAIRLRTIAEASRATAEQLRAEDERYSKPIPEVQAAIAKFSRDPHHNEPAGTGEAGHDFATRPMESFR